jgi:hypothetical protein
MKLRSILIALAVLIILSAVSLLTLQFDPEVVKAGSTRKLYMPLVGKPQVPPTATPTPTRTPTPTATPPSSNDFYVKTYSLLTQTENGGCQGNHNVYFSVLDSSGNPMVNEHVYINDIYGNFPNVYSGQKYEKVFNYGYKLAEVTLYSSATYFLVKQYPYGTNVSSDRTQLLSTNTYQISAYWLYKGGYCSNVAACQTIINNRELLCQGHYSWWVQFQASHAF